jgi:ferredoxin-NADP reductase
VSIFIILIVCLLTNKIFSLIFKVPANIESVYITALILILIITPPRFENFFLDFMFLFWVSVLSMASKYIFVYKKKHIFNPVAIATVIILFTLDQPASWWVGNMYLFPIVLIGGFLIIKKIRRWDLVLIFVLVEIVITIFFGILNNSPIIVSLMQLIIYSPLLFFAFIMLTEPLTIPPTKNKRILYASLVGLLFTPMAHFGEFYLTPEIALLIGNLVSFAISPKGKLLLKLKAINQLSPSVCDFVFAPERKINFQPGQYLEWTLAHKKTDNRGNRRYLTIASSPTEADIRIGVKFYPQPSSFKKELLSLEVGDDIFVSQLAGEFVLPKNPKQKLVFIAGGIGITPFRSMIKYLIDKKESRSITLFYSNYILADIVYADIFKEAEGLGIKTVFALTDTEKIPATWSGCKGFVDEQAIKKYVPDYKERLFFVSGPPMMVSACVKTLKKMGIAKRKIKTDYFPGLV